MQQQISTDIYARHGKFFRSRLLVSDPQKIVKIIEEMDSEAKSIRSENMKMCWYMRGGITYNEVMNLSHEERKLIGEIIKENLETTKKTGLNFF
jgi:hypothetical protein